MTKFFRTIESISNEMALAEKALKKYYTMQHDEKKRKILKQDIASLHQYRNQFQIAIEKGMKDIGKWFAPYCECELCNRIKESVNWQYRIWQSYRIACELRVDHICADVNNL